MANPELLAGFTLPILFLKATQKKQVWVPPYTKGDGTYVAGHMAFVHVADDHDDAKVASGQGTYSQKKARAKLAKEDWFHALPDDSHKAAVVMKHATEIQDAETASAALAVFKKAVLAGQPPKPAGWKVFMSLPHDKREAFVAEVKVAGKDAHFLAEYAKHEASQAAASAPVTDEGSNAQEAEKPTQPAPEKPLLAPTVHLGGSAYVKQDGVWGEIDHTDGQFYAAKPGFVAAIHIKLGEPVPAAVLAGLSDHHKVSIAHGLAENDGVPKERSEAALGLAPVEPEKPAAPAPLDHGVLNVPGKTSSINAELDKHKAQQEKEAKAKAKEDSAEFKSDKAKAKALFAEYGKGMLEKHGPKFGEKKLADALDQMVKWEPKKFIHMAETFQKEQAAAQAAPPVPAPAAPSPKVVSASVKLTPAAPAADSGVVLAKISGAFLPDTNTNASAVNAKLSAISAAVKAGDAQALLGMSFGTNTYGKKAASLANEALQVLGSAHTVSPGQKAGTHAALGSVLPAAAPPVAPAAAPAPVPAAEDGPKEGDTKVENGVTYVLKNGRWHKVKQAAQAAPAPAPSAPVMSHVYEHTTDGHDKFWAVAVDGSHLSVAWGKNGTTGQKKVKPFASPAAAHAEMEKLIKEKTGKGYQKQYSEPVDGFAPVSSAAAAPAKPAPKVVAAKKAKVTKPAPAAPASAAAGDAPVAVDSWSQLGPQKGYNPGGTFLAPDGQQWYCKFPAGGEKVVKNELLASKLYQLAGVGAPEVMLVTQGGKVGIASKMIAGAKTDKAALLAGKAPGILDGFAVDAWLANWDTVGNNPAAGKGFDNILIGPDGKAVRIDAGGALQYGGAGGKKQTFGNEVIELKTMLDPAKNANTAAVFGKMGQADIVASVAKVAAIPDQLILDHALKYGPGDLAARQALGQKLVARKHNMLAQYPAAAKATRKPAAKKEKKPIVFDPSKLGAAPDFMNWKGPGNHGPASAEYKNVANQEGVNDLLKVAQAGNIDAIKNHQMPFYGPDGAITHMVSPLNHPSQYVKGYAQQLINEIDAQLNPPKPFRWDGDSPLAALHVAYPKVKDITAPGVEKLGYYVRLGKPGTISEASLNLPAKSTWKNGKLSRKTYSPAAQAVTAKLPQQQKDALKSYTGSGYSEINHSLWKGNPVGAAKSAEEALLTLGHEITPGTVLSRKISIHGADLDALTKSVGSVLQEPAVMSTSIRPTCWSGNVHFKITVGPGVKGLYVGPGSTGGNSALSKNAGEDEMLLPPNTRLLVQAVKPGKNGDEDGFGESSTWIIEVLVLPTH